MSSKLLSSLVSEPADEPKATRVPGKLASLGLPLGLLIGFAVILSLLFGDRLLPARTLTVANVLTLADNSATVSQATQSAPSADLFDAPVRFQASGWFEPAPQPTKVSALVSGVINEVFVLEGEAVKKGDAIATLIDDDARLDLATAQAALTATQARLAAVDASITATRTEQRTMQEQLNAANAVLELRRDTARRFEGAGKEAVAMMEIVESRQMVAVQEAEVAAVKAKIDGVEARLMELESEKSVVEADIALAKTEVARRKLALERTRILAPMDARVMRLLVYPGQQRMLGPDNKDSAAIAYLYEPDHMQARIDVPLAEAAKLQIGQPVKLRTNFLPDEIFKGRVARITGEADLQRNTLQAKVDVLQPGDLLRPDMLCRAEFLAPPASEAAPGTPIKHAARVSIYAPEAAIRDRESSAANLWVVDDSSEHIRKQQVTLGQSLRENYIHVASGLQPGDRVVIDPPADLQDGDRINVKRLTKNEQ